MNASTSYMLIEEQRREWEGLPKGPSAFRLLGMAEYYREKFVDNQKPPESKSTEQFIHEMVRIKLALC